MSIRAVAKRIVQATPMGRKWLASRRSAQRARDWSTVNSARFGKTELSIFTNVGLGDIMIARQICREFVEYCERQGDPQLGGIVITGGAWPPEFSVARGDHNIYWWWSMNGQDDWLKTYLAGISVQPDAIACPSSWCLNYAQKAGCKTLYLPLAAGNSFQPLDRRRNGIGYAGSRGHKDSSQVEAILGPFRDDPDFEWAANIGAPTDKNAPRLLSEFYNRKQLTLGMTESYQEKAGMVNNRVFEVLATGTPFIIHAHRGLEEVLGYPFPYQTNSAAQTRQLSNEILSDYPKHLEIFREYQRNIDSKHRYPHRLGALLRFLSQN